jgi:thymidylate synthase
MIAAACDLRPGTFVHTLGDAHLYSNHFDQARLQLTRMPGPLAQLVLRRVPANIDGFTFEDFEITGYEAAPNIPAPIAV